MRKLTAAGYAAFVASNRIAVVHFDAEWDVAYRPIVRRRMAEVEREFGERASVGEVDIDAHPELATSIPILNVPTVAYYRDGRLVSALIGAGQNVLERVARVGRGELIGYDDGLNGLTPPATTSSPR